MHSSHHNSGGVKRNWSLPFELRLSAGTIIVPEKREFYLHPASLSRLAYIFPMSPMPITPTVKLLKSIVLAISIPEEMKPRTKLKPETNAVKEHPQGSASLNTK